MVGEVVGTGLCPRLGPGWWVTVFALTATTVLWGAGQFWAMPSPDLSWHGVSLLLSTWAMALMAVILLATARSRMIEPLFGGLDRAVALHRLLGPIAVGLVVVHVLLYIPTTLERGGSIADLVVPFWSPLVNNFNAVMFVLLLAAVGVAYSRRLRYERWLSLHGLMGPIFLGTSAHALLAGPTVQAFEPLRWWLWLLVFIGLGAWGYRVLIYRRAAPRCNYRVQSVTRRGADALDLVLRPHDRRLLYEPGTFVFINRPGADGGRWEPHPFSISSSPTERDLRLSIRQVGDFTRSLANLQRGDAIEVFGPFGGFTMHRFARYRRFVCIGAGIGITPFLSMLRFEATNDDFRRLWLWYVVHDAADAPYDAELREGVDRADSYVDYELWPTSERGRLTAAQVVDAVRPLEDFAVMLCGPPAFMRSMTRQFIAQGVPPERIISEDFSFHTTRPGRSSPRPDRGADGGLSTAVALPPGQGYKAAPSRSEETVLRCPSGGETAGE